VAAEVLVNLHSIVLRRSECPERSLAQTRSPLLSGEASHLRGLRVRHPRRTFTVVSNDRVSRYGISEPPDHHHSLSRSTRAFPFQRCPMPLINNAVCLFLIIALSCSSFGQGQKEKKTIAPTVLVTVGRPNIWTMEQAHYLLEKNRAHDLGIAVADLGPLDANEIVGLRIDALRTLLTAQAQYDQAAGVKNSTARSQYKIDAERYNRLRTQLDDLRGKQAAKDGQLAAAQFELDTLNAQKSPDPTKVADQTAVVARLKAEKTALDDEYQSISSSLGNEPTPSVTSTVPQETGTPPTVIGSNSTFDTLLKGIPTGTLGQPKIQASIKLDNYINLQYEIVAKQLTLLRDAVGPNKRVIFLELPQSIYATQKFKPYPDLPALWGHHLAQTWWQIDSIELAEPGVSVDPLEAPPDGAEIARLRTICPNKFTTNASNSLSDCPHEGKPFEGFEQLVQNDSAALKAAAAESWIKNWKFTTILTNPAKEQAANAQPSGCQGQQAYPCGSYALDLIPRQGGLNVADMQSVSRAYGFSGLFGLLSGLGAKARYERQRDQYSQFAQQEVFASAFGKGETRFGWTFGPLPGTKRLAPGLRTTYAVLVVPAHARTLTLSARGCGYRRRVVPVDPFQPEFIQNNEECSDVRKFVIDIPSSREGFHVTRVFYKPAPAGQRTTLELIGDFTPQVGILINATPLQKVVSIGQPLIEQTAFTVPDNAGDKEVKGVFELVGTNKLVVTFSMPATFVGTPQIAVVTPANGAVINNFRAWINKRTSDVNLAHQTSLAASDAEPMFYPGLSITRMSPEFPTPASLPSVMLQVFGQGFKKNPSHGESAKLLLNGKEFARTAEDHADPSLGEFKIDDDTRIRVLFKREDAYPHWHVDFFLKDTPGASLSSDDPGPPVSATCAVDPGGSGSKDSPYQLRVTGDLLGSGFPPTSKDDNLVITSSALKSPKEWDVEAISGKSLRDAVFVLKGWDAHDFRFCDCQGAPKLAGCLAKNTGAHGGNNKKGSKDKQDAKTKQ
jgi:hypothetical protein